jgi:hypothetical protein
MPTRQSRFEALMGWILMMEFSTSHMLSKQGVFILDDGLLDEPSWCNRYFLSVTILRFEFWRNTTTEAEEKVEYIFLFS